MPAPYDTLASVMNTARVRLNDAIAALAGDVVTDAQPFTLPAVNAAWRRLQALLVEMGCSVFTKRAALDVPAVGSANPVSELLLDWDSIPALPADLISPLKLWERSDGSTGKYSNMDQFFDGLPPVTRGKLHKCWEWRNEKLVLPGATQAMDILMRYACFAADFTNISTDKVPIVRALDPLAWFICAEFAAPRGDLDAGAFEAKAVAAARQIFARDLTPGHAMEERMEQGKVPE